MRRNAYLSHLLAWLAFVVGVRIAMMLWTEWLAGLVLLPLPFYLVHDHLLWRWRRKRGPLYAACRSVRLGLWQRRRPRREEMDPLPHKPQGFCPKCGYPVNLGRCPECGHEITLANIRTKPSGFLRRHRLKLIAISAVVVLFIGGHFLFTQAAWLSHLSLESVTRLHDWGYQEALYELERRFSSGKLKPHELLTLFKHSLVGEISVASPYPRDVHVPVDFRLRMNVSTMNSSIFCDIQDWTLELDGEQIRKSVTPNDPATADESLFFKLQITPPGEHVLCIYGEVTVYDLNSLKTSPEPDAYAIPFSVEKRYKVDERSAAEMIETSDQLLAEGQADDQPLSAYVRHATWFDFDARKKTEKNHLIVKTNKKCLPSCAIAGLVFARPKGGGKFTRLGGRYLHGFDSVALDIDNFPELVQAEVLDVRIEPDAREAAYGSRMRCRRFYGKTLEMSAQKRDWSPR